MNKLTLTSFVLFFLLPKKVLNAYAKGSGVAIQREEHGITVKKLISHFAPYS